LLAARDATARHMAELALEHTLEEQARTLAEREVLLREVHHRVKNNLQIVSSLLAMQGDRTESDEARAALEHSGTRVRSMALVHQLLYGGKNLAYVDLAEYARVLAHELRSALEPRAELDLELHPADVTIETAVPCALVLNELLTNAFKHGGLKIVTALVKQMGGTLDVGKGEGGSFTLTIPKLDRPEVAVPRSFPPLHTESRA